MTLESYEKAKEIVRKINSVDNEIKELRSLLDTSSDLSKWRMELRPSTTFSSKSIDHCGMLPEFIRAILEKELAKYSELKEELGKL